MKTKKENLEEAEKNMELPQEEENNDKDVGQKKAKKPRRQRFLACLRRAWRAITGCVRRKTSRPEKKRSEEVPEPRGVRVEEQTSSPEKKESSEEVPEPRVLSVEEETSSPEAVNSEELQESNETESRVRVSSETTPDNRTEEIQTPASDDKRGPQWHNVESLHQHLENLLYMLDKLYNPRSGVQHDQVPEEESALNIVDEAGATKEDEKDGQKSACLKIPEQSEISRAEVSSVSNNGNEEPQESDKSSEGGSSPTEIASTGEQCLGAATQAVRAVHATVPLSDTYFQLHELLGEGGFADVYQAQDIIQNQFVAIKVMHKSVFKDDGLDFTERDVLQLSHRSPHLIHGLGAFQTNNYVYFVMELAPGGDLNDFMRCYPFTNEEIRFVGAEIICGTQYLHRNGYVHRDLKPDNILLSATGHIKITDFGLAVRTAIRTSECCGTRGFIAPEAAYKEIYGPAVDYYSIGAILYKMGAFKLPIPVISFRQHKKDLRDYEPVYPAHLDDNLVSLLQGLLCKDQKKRLGDNVRSHPFFSTVNWEEMEAGRVVPPKRLVEAAKAPTFYTTFPIIDWGQEFCPKFQKIFAEFSFVCPEWSRYYHPVIMYSERQSSWFANLFSRR